MALPSDEVLDLSHAQLTADPEPEGALEWRGLMRTEPDFAR